MKWRKRKRKNRPLMRGGGKTMTNYEFCKSIGICPRCMKESHAPGRILCLNCLDKERIRKAEKMEQMTENERREINKRNLNAQKIRYQMRKKEGKCVRCGKPALYGNYCYTHKIKSMEYNRRRTEKKRIERYGVETIPERRKREGKCLYCEEQALLGKNICAYHQELFTKNGKERAAKKKEMSLQCETA